MGKETLVMFLGVWVAVQSFLGFPLAWDMAILAVLGIALLGLGIILRHEALIRLRKHTKEQMFVENNPTEEHNEVSSN